MTQYTEHDESCSSSYNCKGARVKTSSFRAQYVADKLLFSPIAHRNKGEVLFGNSIRKLLMTYTSLLVLSFIFCLLFVYIKMKEQQPMLYQVCLVVKYNENIFNIDYISKKEFNSVLLDNITANCEITI